MTSGRSRKSLPDPFGVVALTVFVGVAAGGGGCTWTGGVGDRLGPVSVVEYLDGGVEADSVLEVYLAFGIVPEVDGLGDECVVLGLEEVFEEVVEDGSLALAEVLALVGLILTAAGSTVAGAGGGAEGGATVLAGLGRLCGGS